VIDVTKKCINPRCGVELADGVEVCGNCGIRQVDPRRQPGPSGNKRVTIGDRVWRLIVGIRLLNFKVGNVNVNVTSGGATGLSALAIMVIIVVVMAQSGAGGRCELFVSPDPSPSGSVLVQPLPGPDGKYKCGEKLTVEAVETEAWRFDRWVGGISPERVNRGVVTLSADRQIVAVFVRR
jgi:hypothetical protein